MQSRIRTLSIILTIFVLAGLVSCYIFFTMIRSRIEKTHEANAAIETQSVHHDENVALTTLLADVGPDIDSLKTRIIDSDGTVPFIDNLEAMAKTSGATVSIDTVDEKPADEGKDYEYLELAISANGSWNHVYTFLGMLESLPNKVTIDHVTLGGNSIDVVDGKNKSTQRVWRGNFIVHILKKK